VNMTRIKTMSDKADIRNIAVPKTLEGYSQEIGRAGHDDLELHDILLW
jgi:superfamily II DNA helicase RecQ